MSGWLAGRPRFAALVCCSGVATQPLCPRQSQPRQAGSSSPAAQRTPSPAPAGRLSGSSCSRFPAAGVPVTPEAQGAPPPHRTPSSGGAAEERPPARPSPSPHEPAAAAATDTPDLFLQQHAPPARRLDFASPLPSHQAGPRGPGCSSPQPPASPALREARAGVQEANAVLHAAQQQRQQLFGLADLLLSAERGRARAAEGQVWEARYQTSMPAMPSAGFRQRVPFYQALLPRAPCTDPSHPLPELQARAAQTRAEAADGLAEQRAASARAAEGAAQQAREQLIVAQAERDEERARAADLGAAVERAQEEAEATLREQAGLKRRLAEAAAHADEQGHRAADAAAEAVALRQELEAAQQRLREGEQRWREAGERLQSELQRAAAREARLAEQQQAAEAEVCALRRSAEAARAERARMEARNASLQQQAEAAAAEAATAHERCASERQQREALQRERGQLWEQLQTANHHIGGLAAECDSLSDSLAEAQRSAHEREAAAAAAAGQQAADAEQLRSLLEESQEQAAALQREIRDREAAMQAQQGMEGELRGALQEAAGVAEAAEREAEALRLSLRLSAAESAEAQRGLQLAGAELSSLRADHSMLSGRLQCIEGSEEACGHLELVELEQLVQMMEGSVPLLRNILTERRVEAARSEMAAAASQQACIVCCAAQRDTFLNCGHLVCRACSERMAACPVCRAPISSRTRAFV